MHAFAKTLMLTAFLTAPLLAANAHEVKSHHRHTSNHNVQSCREFTQKVTIGGRTQYAHGTACLTPGGDWKIVSKNYEREVRKSYKHHHGRHNENRRHEARHTGHDGIVWLSDNRHPHRGW